MTTRSLDDCLPNREWLDYFRDNLDALLTALDVWEMDANGILTDLVAYGHDFGLDRDVAHLRRNARAASRVEFPPYFSRLTALLVAWSDIFLRNVDPAPLGAFGQQVLSWQHPRTGHGPAVSLVTMEETLRESARIVKRIAVAASYLFGLPPRDDQEEPAVDPSNGARQIGGQGGVSGASSVRPGVLGLYVDYRSRSIRRDGCQQVVSLESCPALWAVFQVLFEAGEEQASLERMERKYPGQWSPNTRNVSYNRLRDELVQLGITVKNRRLALIQEELPDAAASQREVNP